MLIAADAREMPLRDLDANFVEGFAPKVQAFTVGHGSGRMLSAPDLDFHAPSTSHCDPMSNTFIPVFILPQRDQQERLFSFQAEPRQENFSYLVGPQITYLIAVQRSAFGRMRLLFVIPAPERLGEELDAWLGNHADLNPFVVSGVDSASEMFVGPRFLDSHVGFPVNDSGEVSKNFVPCHKVTNTTVARTRQYGCDDALRGRKRDSA